MANARAQPHNWDAPEVENCAASEREDGAGEEQRCTCDLIVGLGNCSNSQLPMHAGALLRVRNISRAHIGPRPALAELKHCVSF